MRPDDAKDIVIPETDEALLAECEVWTFRGTGPGGQGVNTADSAVRLRHDPSGVTVVSREHRSQLRNKQECLRKLRERLSKLNEPPPPPRVRTRPTRASKERRIAAKRQVARKKKARGKPDRDD